MKIKIFIRNLILGLFSVTLIAIPAPISADMTFSLEPTTSERTNVINDQISFVKAYIEGLKEEGKTVRLIIGVDNGDSSIDSRFDDTYIFLNKNQKNPSNPRSLSVNCNSLEELKLIASVFDNTFDEILVDYGRFVDGYWTDMNLWYIRAMLSPYGKFIFSPDAYPWLHGHIEAYSNSKLFDDPTGKKLYDIMTNVFESLPDFESRLVNNFPAPMGRAYENIPARNSIVTRAFLDNFFKKVVIEKNYLPILNWIFKEDREEEGEIIVKYDTVLPFKNGQLAQPIQPVVITAIKNVKLIEGNVENAGGPPPENVSDDIIQ